MAIFRVVVIVETDPPDDYCPEADATIEDQMGAVEAALSQYGKVVELEEIA